jgi:hypothetical protein
VLSQRLHNFRFQSSFEILLAGNSRNFFGSIFLHFFPILFAGFVSSGCEGFMVLCFLHCFVSSSRTLWPCLSVRRIWQATDCSSLFLHFFPQVLEVFGTLSCSRILCWRLLPPPRSWGARHEVALDGGSPRNWRSQAGQAAGCAEFRVAARVSDFPVEPFSS